MPNLFPLLSRHMHCIRVEQSRALSWKLAAGEAQSSSIASQIMLTSSMKISILISSITS
jgi:hypothetical protein